MDDFKTILFRVVGAFMALIVTFIGLTFIFSCGLDFKCQQSTPIVGTPIPTLVPATLPAPVSDGVADAFGKCQVKAMDLLGAWVDAGAPEMDAFPFTDLDGNSCQGTFDADIWPLLNENNVWFPASLSCTSCHNTAFKPDTGGLDLTSYAGLMAGSQRPAADVANGTDILASTWTDSLLYQTLSLTENIPPGHPSLSHPTADLIIYAGAYTPPPTQLPVPSPTP